MGFQHRLLSTLKGGPDRPPTLLYIRSSTWFITLVVTFAAFTDVFLYSVIVPVLPFALVSRIGVDHSKVQFWTSVMLATYGGACVVGSPFAGWIADRTLTRRGPLLFGLCLLTGATLMLCLARSIGVFVVGRVLQGLSGAILWTTSLALLVDTVGLEGIGLAIGWMGMGLTMSVMLGPLLGGAVFDTAGYYPVFAMCFGLLGLDIFFRLVLVERKVAQKWLPSTVGQGISSLDPDDVAINGQSVSIEDLEKNALASSANATLGLTIVRPSEPSSATEGSRFGPLLALLKSPRFLAALFANFAVSVLLSAYDSTLPIFVETYFHWSSLGGGLIFLPMTIPSLLAPLVGFLTDRWGPKWMAVIGLVWTIPFLVLLRLVQHNSIRQKVLLCGLLFGSGCGTMTALMPLVAEISLSAGAVAGGVTSAYAQAYGLFNTAYAGGMLVGPIWGGAIRDTYGGSLSGLGWSFAVWTGVTSLVCLVFTGQRLHFPSFHKRQST